MARTTTHAVDTVAEPDDTRSREVWARWARDREAREVQRTINAELEARDAANLPIYPRECAERIAEDMQTVAPDWRHIRPTLGPAWRRLLKAQPELSPELVAQREATITAVFNAVPRHLRGSVDDLRTLIDLLLAGHETAAYLVGFESGRLVERVREDARGRVRTSSRPQVTRATTDDNDGLRLHAGEKGGAR